MLIDRIIKFKLKGPGPHSRSSTPKLVIFMINQKFLKENLRVDYYLPLKYCRKQCVLLPSISAQSLAQFDTKIQDFKRVLELNCK